MDAPKGIPYGSRDTAHIPQPDPDTFWPFTAGRERTIGIDPVLAFRVDVIHDTWIEGTQTLGLQTVSGELHLDRPVVITRNSNGDPLVTLTLRRISGGIAFIQVSVDPRVYRGSRASIRRFAAAKSPQAKPESA